VVAATTAGRTGPLFSLIAAGKTDALEQSHFRDVSDHRTYHSESAWMTADTFRRWPAWLRSIHDDGESLWLILDCYSVHCQEKVKCYANDLGINLLFIPPGLADELQPPDRFLFGVLKANSRCLYRANVTELGAMNKQIATASLVRTWEAVSSEVVNP
jgi:hypothetical protein